ncbi:MAG: flagellar motor protein MotA, partial [Alphaproteobacteria bacterium]|nr:flagellar motor protein MotA [Alphaproteobacteria bacterium]
MTRPTIYLIRMGIFLGVVAALAAVLSFTLLDAFRANIGLNGVILLVLLWGIIHSFRNVASLGREVTWIESFRRDQAAVTSNISPRLLSPMATMLGERAAGRFSLSTTAMRTLLDGIWSRLDERRELARYVIGLLVFLGLLGTFWGLLETVRSIGGVIASLSVGGGGDVSAVFEELKAGLQAPLSGMGTAFSSSLFGLAGSLVVGFLELQAGQAQNRFYNDLEEWLSG